MSADRSVVEARSATLDRDTLADARIHFYSARYDDAAAASLLPGSSNPEDPAAELAACELRTSALLFQLKRALDDRPDKKKALETCVTCRDVLAAFLRDTARGQALARARLERKPGDETALFFLGKIDLNYVWLHLGTLGRKTGWDQYWEARKSLDAVLKANPRHVRARVARAWIDYIVDTRMPRGTRWILGGGNRKRALATIRDAAVAEADVFVRAEAEFALWDMLIRERNLSEATTVARRLADAFPDNQEVRRFLQAHDSDGQP